jgi:hypothetical protein
VYHFTQKQIKNQSSFLVFILKENKQVHIGSIVVVSFRLIRKIILDKDQIVGQLFEVNIELEIFD